MDLTLKTRPRSRANARVAGLAGGLAGIALAALAACGPGGGGGGALSVKSTIFGYDPFTGNFDASGEQGQAPLIPLNMCVVFDFSDDIKTSSVGSQSILIQELDTSVTPPAAGPLAAATFQVAGNRITICPLITFTSTNATFGWGSQSAEKTYQILFQVAPSTSIVTSIHGKAVSARDRGPYLFKTSKQIFDQKAGAPIPTVRLLDPTSGAAIVTLANTTAPNIPFDPVPNIEVKFDEPVTPFTAVDPSGNGTSDNIHIELDRDGNLATNDRVIIPGTFVLTETSADATVLWTSLIKELPTDLTNGCVYVVTIDGTVQDLSGNDKVSQTNNPGANDTFTFSTVPGASTLPVTPPLTEPFTVQTQNDLTATSAKWGTSIAGFLTAGIGGGTGADGAFDPNRSTFQSAPPAGVTVDVPNKKVTLSTVSGAVQRQYEFTSFLIPVGWTVVATGKFPLNLQCTGSATLNGSLDISGADGAFYATGAVVGGTAGAAAVGGAAGGRGGATTDASNVDTFFPNKGGAPVSYAKLACGTSGATNQGLSGRSTNLDTAAFTLTDSNFATSLNGLVTTNLWVQPNVGLDDYRFERYHTAFKVASIASGVVTVISNTADASYRGELSQETSNPYLESDGSGGFRTPLLSEKFDAYVIGELRGLSGSNTFDLDLDGVANNVAKTNAGIGSEPQSVTQTFLTLGHSGGGGGGGGIVAAGAKGDDDPTVASGAGSFGGTGFEGSAGGVAAPTGLVAQRVDSDTIRLSTAVFDNGSGSADATFAGHLINPNVNQGNVFTIVSVDAVDTVTIAPITTSSGAVINLNNTTISVGNTARITPPYAAGGTGGGGAGVHCAGSSKTPANHSGHPAVNDSRQKNPGTTVGFYDDDSDAAQTQDGLEDTVGGDAIFALPRWIPGGGGGAGGGAVRLVAAGNVDITAVGQILAEGGEGGRSDLAGLTAASGGGGGAGGTVFVGAGGTISVAQGGKLSAAGGLGGSQGFGIKGGDGGAGRIRLENALGNLQPINFLGATVPATTVESLGLFPGGGKSIAQSLFVPTGALSPQYQKIVITYTTKENGVTISANYTVTRTGTVDPASTLTVPPFSVLISATAADAVTGLANTAVATVFKDPIVANAGTAISNYDTKAYVRFRVVLNDPTVPLSIGGKLYTDIRIDQFELDVDSVKP